MGQPPVWRIDVSIPAAAVPAFEAALAELGGAVASDVPEAPAPGKYAEVNLQAYLDAEPGRPRLTALLAGAALRAGVNVPEAKVERLPDVDWVTESHKALPAIQRLGDADQPIVSGRDAEVHEHRPAVGLERFGELLGPALVFAGIADEDVVHGVTVRLGSRRTLEATVLAATARSGDHPVARSDSEGRVAHGHDLAGG